MNKKLLIALLISTVPTVSYAACNDESQSQIHEPVQFEENYITFSKEPLEVSEQSSGEITEYQIGLNLYDCVSRTSTLLDKLPFLASSGNVSSAFVLPVGIRNELVIIHESDVSNSATGVNYAGKYYNVLAYKKNGTQVNLDTHLTEFFGAGGDIKNDKNTTTYEFPYKNKSTIDFIVRTKDFKDLMNSKPLHKTIKSKAYIYEDPIEATKTKKYLIKGDKIKLYKQQAGWCLSGYKNLKNIENKYWINCKKVSNLFNDIAN